MALVHSEIAHLLDVVAKLYPRENTQRIAVLADVFKPHYDYQTCLAVLKAHAAQNIWLVLPTLSEELEEAHCDKATQVQTVVKVATMESMTRRQQLDAQQRQADADLARMDERIALAGTDALAEATRRVLERHPYLVKLVKRDLRDSPTLKSFVAAELAQMEQERRIA